MAEPYRDRKQKPDPFTAEDFSLRNPNPQETQNKRDHINRMRKSLDMIAVKKGQKKNAKRSKGVGRKVADKKRQHPRK